MEERVLRTVLMRLYDDILSGCTIEELKASIEFEVYKLDNDSSQIERVVIKPVVTNYEPHRFDNKEEYEKVLRDLTKIVERLIKQGMMPQIGWRIEEDHPDGDLWYITDITYVSNKLEIEMEF
jgi:hypothetical protein